MSLDKSVGLTSQFTKDNFLNLVLSGLIALSTLFSLTIHRWLGIDFFICVAISIFVLFRSKKEDVDVSRLTPLFIVTFCSPCIAILVSQTIRMDWSFPYYDSPIRFMMAIPIFLMILRKNLAIGKILSYSVPLTPIITLLVVPFLPKEGWGIEPTRLGTYFVDPLTFGWVMLCFGLLSLFTWKMNPQRSKKLSTVFTLSGFFTGVYLSIASGSRTGWLALPVVLLILVVDFLPKGKKMKYSALALTLVMVLTIALYQYSNTVKERVDIAASEIKSYQMHAVNIDNSVGMRLSFARMGYYLFTLRPLSGFGDHDFKERINDPFPSSFTTQFTRDFPVTAGFHNEFTTNMVRSGIWGLMSTALLFFVPLGIFIYGLKKTICPEIALFGFAFVVCELISGMSTEVFNLKFTATLYAFMMAVLCGTVIKAIRQSRHHATE